MRGILEKIYAGIIRRKNRQFDADSTLAADVGVPVISIGNITAGGSGKTPLTAYLCQIALKSGYRPAIVSRGYKRRSKGQIVVSDGRKLLADVDAAGDEPFLLASTLPGCIVVCDKVKMLAARTAIDLGADIILLDDGFQHRRLARCCDIVIINRQTLDEKHLLPKGYLREPLESLWRADILCLTEGITKEEIEKKYVYLREKHIFTLEKKYADFKCVVPIEGHAASSVEGAQVLAFAAIAGPVRFFEALYERGVRAKHTISFGDHHRYSTKDIEKIISEAQMHSTYICMTTEKDSVKLTKFQPLFRKAGIALFTLPMSFSGREEAEFERAMLSYVEQYRQPR